MFNNVSQVDFFVIIYKSNRSYMQNTSEWYKFYLLGSDNVRFSSQIKEILVMSLNIQDIKFYFKQSFVF